MSIYGNRKEKGAKDSSQNWTWNQQCEIPNTHPLWFCFYLIMLCVQVCMDTCPSDFVMSFIVNYRLINY